MNTKILKADSKTGFHFLAGINREVIPAHVSKLADSIQSLNAIIRPVVVAKLSFLQGGTKTYIIDGQHLYTACLRLKKDIPYIEIGINSLEELIEKIALLNASSKNWTLDDYINTWSYYKKSYGLLKDYIKKYNIERSIIAELMHTGIVSASTRAQGGSAMSKVIKSGTLLMYNQKFSEEVLDYVSDLRSVTKDIGRNEQKIAISVMIEKIKADGGSYNHKAYKKKLESKKTELLLASNDLTKIREILK